MRRVGARWRACLTAGLAAFAVIAPARPVPADVVYNERTDRYWIGLKTDTPEALWQAIRVHGPLVGGREAIGAAQARTSWEVRYARSPRGCYVENATVRVNVTMFLPEWAGVSRASSEMQRYWACVETAVTTHEQRHAEIYRETGERIDRALRAMSDWAPCRELQDRIDDTARAIDAEGQRRQRQFDDDDYRRPRYQACLNTLHKQVAVADRGVDPAKVAASTPRRPASQPEPVPKRDAAIGIGDGGLGGVLANAAVALAALVVAVGAYAAAMGLVMRSDRREEGLD